MPRQGRVHAEQTAFRQTGASDREFGYNVERMNSKKKAAQKTRVYRSPLRDERAIQTRTRILDGLVQVMARNGIAELSIPLIAKQAGVSIPSVYRYFPTKRDLITALDEYAHQKGSFTLDEFGPMETPEDVAKIVPLTFKRREAIESTLSAAMNSRLGYTMRHQEFVERAKHFSKALRSAAKNLNRKEHLVGLASEADCTEVRWERKPKSRPPKDANRDFQSGRPYD
jgi:AcrR family transcriptional regulator